MRGALVKTISLFLILGCTTSSIVEAGKKKLGATHNILTNRENTGASPEDEIYSPLPNLKNLASWFDNCTDQEADQNQNELPLDSGFEKQLEELGLEDYMIVEVPRDHSCWAHVLRLQAGDYFGYKDIKEILKGTLEEDLKKHLLSEGSEGSRSSVYHARSRCYQELIDDEWPSFDYLGPFLSQLLGRAIVIVSLDSKESSLLSDQVFHMYPPDDEPTYVGANKPESSHFDKAVKLGWLLNEQHFVALVKKDEKNIVCPICLDDLKLGQAIQSTNCFHLFHEECLREHFARNLQYTCPLCRSTQPKPKDVADTDYRSNNTPLQRSNALCNCGLSFDSARLLESHRLGSTDARCTGNTTCGCGLSFDSATLLNSHRQGSMDARCKRKRNRSTTCGCGLSFNSVSLLESHRQGSTDARCTGKRKGKLNITCGCGLSFDSVSLLNSHHRVSHHRGSTDAR